MSWIEDNGKNNVIVYDQIFSKMKSKIIINGNDNFIKLGINVMFRHSVIVLEGNFNKCIIEENVQIKNNKFDIRDKSFVHIKKDSTLGRGEIVCAENSEVIIGQNCMFAAYYRIRTSDIHPIWNIEDGKRINFSRNVIIDEHVWLTRDVSVMKGAEIKSHSIVANSSIVTKKFQESFLLLGGTPAKILKKGITWSRNSYNTIKEDPYLKKAFDINE